MIKEMKRTEGKTGWNKSTRKANLTRQRKNIGENGKRLLRCDIDTQDIVTLEHKDISK